MFGSLMSCSFENCRKFIATAICLSALVLAGMIPASGSAAAHQGHHPSQQSGHILQPHTDAQAATSRTEQDAVAAHGASGAHVLVHGIRDKSCCHDVCPTERRGALLASSASGPRAKSFATIRWNAWLSALSVVSTPIDREARGERCSPDQRRGFALPDGGRTVVTETGRFRI